MPLENTPQLWATLWIPVVLVVIAIIGPIKTQKPIVGQGEEVSVVKGQHAFLEDKKHINITVSPGDRCIVKVIREAVPRVVGVLQPDIFPCEFGPDAVKYVHFGGPAPSKDTVQMLVRYDTAVDSQIMPMKMYVDVKDSPSNVITKNVPLDVKTLAGRSVPIDGAILEFKYDVSTETCRLVLENRARGVPAHGHVIGMDFEDRLDCDTFLNKGITYQHGNAKKSPKNDYIPFALEISDQNGDLKHQENFQVVVNIEEGQDNTPPRLSFSAVQLMAVNQFILTPITSEVLKGEDNETSSPNLIFKIKSIFGPQDGAIINTDDQNLPVSSFSQKDVLDLKIAYKPPAEDSDVKRVIDATLEVLDELGTKSDPFTLTFIVNPKNTLAPIVITNKGVQLFEGQSRPISSADNLQVTDEDNLDQVTLTVYDGLRHGDLLLSGSPVRQITADDLKTGDVTYQHDGSDSFSDNIIFKLSDGKHSIDFLFPVTIFPENDQPPVLTVNNELIINEKEEGPINDTILSAIDVDSEIANVSYVVSPNQSFAGEFLLKQTDIPSDPQNWVYENGEYEKSVLSWLQSDLENGNVSFRYKGDRLLEPVVNRIRFQILDDYDPPNVSPEHELIIRIFPLDDTPPEPAAGVPLQTTVHEFETKPITRKELRYSDKETDDRKLKFKVTAKPTDTDPANALDPGKLVETSNTNKEITEFTQSQINHHKVSYKPPSIELGITPRVIQFEFEVEDGAGNVKPNQKFYIFIQPIDNKPPVVFNKGLTVAENDAVVLTKDELDVTDPDTDVRDIHFTLKVPPKFGVLEHSSLSLDIGNSFTRPDIDNGLVKYAQNGDEVVSDEFTLDVSDGIHHVQAIVPITILAVDDQPPDVILTSGDLGLHLYVNENGSVPLTSSIIKATDPDTDDSQVMFFVKQMPKLGTINVGGKPVDRFKQQDIYNNDVTYVHDQVEIGPKPVNDEFNLTISDQAQLVAGGTKVQTVAFNITIVPIDSIAPVVQIGDLLVVAEGQKTAITSQHINATDEDSDVGRTTCTIAVQPSHGYIENVSPRPGSEKLGVGLPLSAFTFNDVNNGVINYVQSVHHSVEPTDDSFVFHCSDGVNQSPKYSFPVNITPVNDEEPKIYFRDFIVEEGNDLVIDTPILNADDLDVPKDNLVFRIVSKPVNGRILSRNQSSNQDVETFTIEDISMGSSIVYAHDSSETAKDVFVVVVTDGLHNTSQKISIEIVPVDDETPRLTINNGLDIDIGDFAPITKDILKAEDLDSDDGNLTFVVRKEPDYGSILLLDSFGAPLQNLTQGMNFTQNGINDELIAYQHLSDFGDRDIIKLDVTDGTNRLINRYFYISVDGFDDVFPDVINKGVQLPEGGKVILTTDILSTTDINSPDEHLQFIITRSPDRGHVENSNNPGTPVKTFTQLDLAGNKVYYVHTSKDEIKMDSFEFEVSDGFNSVYRTFRISITDVDNKKPVVFMTTMKVKEGRSTYVTPFELKIDDKDTDDSKLKFALTQVPVHGVLLHDKKKKIQSFTMEDLNNNLVTYQHDGSDSLEDSFSFIVTDGTHDDFFVYPSMSDTTAEPQLMAIKVVPVDNALPQITVNTGSSAVSSLDDEDVPLLVGKNGFGLTNKMLKAEDRDSTNSKLRYVLQKRPENGVVINLRTGNRSVTSFRQGDIDNLMIYYILNDGINATSDRFFFDIVDTGGNMLKNKSFIINWAWISLPSSFISVNESEEMLVVKLSRRGYLGETSFVGLKTIDKTAKTKEDFSESYAKQVQFNPGQTEAEWNLKINSDDIYEAIENFELVLQEPILAVLESPISADVQIIDNEDVSIVSIPEEHYSVKEDSGELIIPVKRSGDLSKEMLVVCFTVSGSAVGTLPSTVLSYSDYISRPEDPSGFVRFGQNQDTAECPVTIIDDSLYENKESFEVVLSGAIGGVIGSRMKTTVTILSDQNDVPTFYLDSAEYHVDESIGQIEGKVWRSGSDLSHSSSVTVQSKPSDVPSAQVSYDYVGIGKNLNFAPGVTLQTFKITILDDLGQPLLEGPETFEVALRVPVNASVGSPNLTVITINDSISDLPTMKFKEEAYFGKENDGEITAFIVRRGDINHESSVHCYTRQDSAKVDADFIERPDSDASIVNFKPGEFEKPCVLKLVNNSIHEPEKSLKLVLGSPQSKTAGGAQIGHPDTANITISDKNDESIIMFEKKRYSVEEPKNAQDVKTVSIHVIRKGDVSKLAVVRIHTKDGSAKSGTDYFGISKDLLFKPNEMMKSVDIEILHDTEKEHREALTVHLKAGKNTVARIENKKVIVYIEEKDLVADVTFPSPPLVVSLRDYDTAETASTSPLPGYPIVCITPCDPKHPEFSKTGDLCTKEGINNSLTEFRWRVAAPTGKDGVSSDMRNVESTTFFANPHRISLDSIYFGAGSRVQCAARAVNHDGDSGLELFSPVVTINLKDGICTPRILGSYGAEPFTAKMRYTGLTDPDHPNRVKLSVIIPHRDGMLPVISTSPLSNFQLTLSPDGMRVGNHRCSNLLDYNEVATKQGFITKETKDANIIGEVEPYQFSKELRTEPTLRFYKNLNLEDCTWKFETYYDMSELITHCGGVIGTDGQVLNLIQSYVSVNVPLYVSYIFHSPVASGGWLHNDLESDLRLAFVYDTAILWQEGISAPEESQLQGYLYPTSMRIQNDGRLVVNFRTKARFKGNFVLSHPSVQTLSMVASADQPDLTFTLKMKRVEPTFAQPEQEWEFISDYAVKDYSGSYVIKLIPCTVTDDIRFTPQSVCNPREPISFDLQVRFQQVSDPVPEKFSLNTQFHLMRKRSAWLSNETAGLQSNSDVSFTKGDTIYGRIMVDPVQTLGQSFQMGIEKCYLCTGVDGYIPKYDPENQEYGCVARTSNLLHNFKIIDKDNPDAADKEFRNVPFHASLLSEDFKLDVQPLAGSDGFKLDSTPLFEVVYGRQWFIHCIYTVKSEKNSHRGIGKRSIQEHHHVMHGWNGQSAHSDKMKRNAQEALQIGVKGKGTNLHVVNLKYDDISLRSNDGDGLYEIGANSHQGGHKVVPVWPIIIGIIIFILVIAVVILIGARRRRKEHNHLRVPTPRTSRRVAATVAVANTHGNGRVITARKYRPKGEQTEV